MGDLPKSSQESQTSKIEKKMAEARRIKSNRKGTTTVDHLIQEHTQANTISNSAEKKEKLISVRVKQSTFDLFKNICETRGTNVNAQINILISDYVVDYKKYLNN